MTRDIIIEELQNRGYNAEAQTTIKNGVALDGIRISANSDIAPVIYTDEIIRKALEYNKDLDEVVGAIIGIYESHKSFEFNVDEVLNRDFILSHVYIGLQKESSEELIKRECYLDGIESYLYIRNNAVNNESYSIKLSYPVLNKVNITTQELWEYAEKNTYAETTIQSMAEIMAVMFDMEFDEEMESLSPMYVISNESKVKGASAILNKDMLLEFASKHNTNKLIVLPSSIHEMILVPYSEEMDIDEFSEMVSEVNNTQVDPTEQLTNKAYIINL